LRVDGHHCPVMAERFANSDDCYLILGATPPNHADCESADGRPRTVSYAMARLARMVGEDAPRLSRETIVDLAEQVVDAQACQVANAIACNLSPDVSQCSILFTGHGRELARRCLNQLQSNTSYGVPTVEFKVSWLDELVSLEQSRCAPALAVAVLRRVHNSQNSSSPSGL
jgi:(4-(4-[2-(gamma-L-glutamylamino)ethyl]phenoxymethyl)furan-2-yl)methanamine synthase